MRSNQHSQGNEEKNEFSSKCYNDSVNDWNIWDSSSDDQDDEGDESNKQLNDRLVSKFIFIKSTSVSLGPIIPCLPIWK